MIASSCTEKNTRAKPTLRISRYLKECWMKPDKGLLDINFFRLN